MFFSNFSPFKLLLGSVVLQTTVNLVGGFSPPLSDADVQGVQASKTDPSQRLLSSTGPSLTISTTCSFPFLNDTPSPCNEMFPEPFPNEELQSMKFIYNGGRCDESWNMQAGSFTCSHHGPVDPPGGSAHITITDRQGRGHQYFSDTVPVGGVFEIQNIRDLQVLVHIYAENEPHNEADDWYQELLFVVKPSVAAISIGDTYGGLTVVEMVSEKTTQKSYGLASYSIDICNEGTGEANLIGLVGTIGDNSAVDLSSSISEPALGTHECSSVNWEDTLDIFNRESQLTTVTVKGTDGLEASSTIELNPLTTMLEMMP